MSMRPGRIVVATGVALAVVTAAAFAATGHLRSKGCIADTAHNTDNCQTTEGLYFANGVVVSADGRSVYAVGAADNAVVRFKRNRRTGAVTPKGCIAETGDNPGGCAKTAKGLSYTQTLAISPDGKSLYVGGYEANSVAIFKRNRKTGALTSRGCVGEKGDNPDNCGKTAGGLQNPETMAANPDGRTLYVGGDVSTVVILRRNTKTGALAAGGCVADEGNNFAQCKVTAKGLGGDVAVGVSPNGKSVYASGGNDSAIATFKRNTTTGALRREGVCIADSGSNPDGCPETTIGLGLIDSIAVAPDGRSVYTTAHNSGALALFKRNRATGELSPRGCYSGGGCSHTVGGLSSPSSVAVSPDSKSVYVTGRGSDAIVAFARNRSTGALTTKQCIADPVNNPDGCVETAPGMDTPSGVTISPNGKSVYVSSNGDSAIVRFHRSP